MRIKRHPRFSQVINFSLTFRLSNTNHYDMSNSMSFDKKAYQREYMARKRALASEKKEPESDTATPETGDDSPVTKLYQKVSGILSDPYNPEPDISSEVTGDEGMTPTDQVKEKDRPWWYVFGKVIREVDCWLCGKRYETRLEMSRFCSPKCKTAYLDSAAHLRVN